MKQRKGSEAKKAYLMLFFDINGKNNIIFSVLNMNKTIF
jgi:hypothetical protein